MQQKNIISPKTLFLKKTHRYFQTTTIYKNSNILKKHCLYKPNKQVYTAGAKGLAPWIPSAATALNAAAGGLVRLNETSDRQKSGGRIAEGKRTDCFGLRVMADGLFGLNSDYIEGLV
jgi:hypothetical protein